MRQQDYDRAKARCGEEIAKLCREHGYGWSWTRGVGGYLLWGDHVERDGPPWKSMFRALRLLEFRGRPWPSARVQSRPDPDLSTPQEMIEAEREKLQAVAEHFRQRQESGQLIGVEADLASARDALEKQIRRTENVVAEPLSKIKRVLKVWVHQSELAAGEARPLPELNDTKKEWNKLLRASREGLRGVKKDARILWEIVIHGGPPQSLEHGLEQKLARHGAPEVVVASTKAVVLHIYREDVSPHLRSVRQLDKKRVLYEKNLFRILHDEKVMSAEEVRQELQERHSRKHKKTLARRKRAVATILLLWDTDAKEHVRRPSWEEADAKDLFKKVAEQPGEEHLRGDTPANSIEDYFRRKLANEDFPTGGNMEDWFELARKWAEDVPKGLFDAE